LVYWDYYHLDTEFYDRMIAVHRDLGHDPVMASGVWTWYRLCYDHQQTIDRVAPCIDSCQKNGIKEFFLTMWGDDGSYCNLDTAFAGLLWCAERANGAEEDNDRFEKIYAALGCGSFRETMAASSMNYPVKHRDNGVGSLSILLWDDPLLGIGWRILNLDDSETYAALEKAINDSLADLSKLTYEIAVGHLLVGKLRFRKSLQNAYDNKNIAQLEHLSQQAIPKMLTLLDEFAVKFRSQWLSRNKYAGMETIQIRIGGLKSRYHELATRLLEFTSNKVSSIPELEVESNEKCIPARERYIDLAISGVW